PIAAGRSFRVCAEPLRSTCRRHAARPHPRTLQPVGLHASVRTSPQSRFGTGRAMYVDVEGWWQRRHRPVTSRHGHLRHVSVGIVPRTEGRLLRPTSTGWAWTFSAVICERLSLACLPSPRNRGRSRKNGTAQAAIPVIFRAPPYDEPPERVPSSHANNLR